MNIRPATLADMPQMLANTQKFIDTIPLVKSIPFDPESMTRAFEQMMEDGLVFVAEVDGVHLGGCGAVKGPLFTNASIQVASERFWWVEPGERAGGVGKALFGTLVNAAKQANCYYLAMIALHNDALPLVEGMYLKAGMSPLERTYIKVL
jgi:L-amino acid N-acyltransferase YncA